VTAMQTGRVRETRRRACLGYSQRDSHADITGYVGISCGVRCGDSDGRARRNGLQHPAPWRGFRTPDTACHWQDAGARCHAAHPHRGAGGPCGAARRARRASPPSARCSLGVCLACRTAAPLRWLRQDTAAARRVSLAYARFRVRPSSGLTPKGGEACRRARAIPGASRSRREVPSHTPYRSMGAPSHAARPRRFRVVAAGSALACTASGPARPAPLRSPFLASRSRHGGTVIRSVIACANARERRWNSAN